MAFDARRLVLVLGAAGLVSALWARHMVAAPETPRTISFFNIHSKETITVVYKKDGKYVPEAMKQLNWILRDWRRNEATTMDPALIDIIWEVHTELGSREPIHVISGYRSRATNDMLRKTVGGQASQSRHILGQAADVHFPDVPIRQLRYSALIREKGGVGYYPTSAIPFVHIDTDRVRHWPRMPRHELALLFPKGRSKHVPEGGPISPADVRAAREKHKDVATQVAAFFDLRQRPRAPILVADAANVPVPRPTLAKAPQRKMALAGAMSIPKLVAEPRVIERSSQLTAGPSLADRGNLDRLVALAAYEPPAGPPIPAKTRPAAGPSQADRDALTRLAALTPPAGEAASRAPMTGATVEGAWIASPAFDEEHPEELSYRPFPVAPMLTDSPSPDDPVLTTIRHPDLAQTLAMIDDEGSAPPMRFRPGQQVARLLWAQQFKGNAVGYDTLGRPEGENPPPAGLTWRTVTTSTR